MEEPIRIRSLGAPAVQPRLLLILGSPNEVFTGALAAVEGIEMVGVAHSASKGIELARALRPNLVLVDLDHDELREPETLAAIREAQPSAKLVGMTTSPSADWVKEAIEAGIRAIVTKPDDVVVLANVLRLAVDLAGGHEESV